VAATGAEYTLNVLVECSNCAGPLNVKTGDKIVKCTYCDRTNQVSKIKHLGETPPQWNPPPIWTPPPFAPALSTVPLKYHRHHNKLVAIIMAACFGLPLLGGIISGIADLATSAADSPASWDEKSTLTCGNSEVLTLDNVNAKVTDGPVFRLGHMCTLTLKNSKLRGRDGIIATGRAKVKLENVTIIVDDHAVKLGTFGELTIKGGKLQSDDEPIKLEHAKLTLDDDALIKSKRTAIDAGSHSKIRIRSGKIKADKGIIGSSHLEVDIGKHGEIDAKDIAVEATHHAKIEVAGTVTAKDIGVSATHNSELTILKGGTVRGRHGYRSDGHGSLVLEGGKLRGSKTGHKAGTHASVTCKKGTIEGKVALDVGNHSKVRLVDCKIKGKRIFPKRFIELEED